MAFRVAPAQDRLTEAVAAGLQMRRPARPTLAGMQIQVRANQSVQTPTSLEDWARGELGQALARFADELTGLEVHLEDVNADRLSADHKRCTLEARLRGHDPVTVRHAAERLDEALRGASDKLLRSLDRALARQRDADHRQRESIRRDTGSQM